MKKYYYFTLSVLLVFFVSTHVFSQTPTNAVNDTGYVGVGTLTPSEKLQVCGNVVVDSSVVVRDSLRVEKDMTIEGNAIIEGNAKVNGDFSISSLADTTNRIVYVDQNGQLKSISFIALSLADPVDPEPSFCEPTGNNVSNIYWQTTPGITYTAITCPNDRVGIGTATPAFGSKLDIMGDISISGTRLHVNTNGNIGIGKANPTSRLDILGDIAISGSRLHVNNNGNIGIGIASPLEKLDVRGTGRFGTTAGYINVGFNTANAIIDNFGTGSLLINYYSNKDVVVGSGTANLICNGSVGIGTGANSTYKLQVAGIIRACKVEVEILSGCDFVFENDYALLPLKKRKETVLYNKHLLNVAPAKQMQEKGADIGETTIGILQNVEEHELYLYNHDERIEKLEKENMELRKMIQELINSKKQ